MQQLAPRMTSSVLDLPEPPAALSPAERLALYAELGKARLTAMAVLAVAMGYLLAGGRADLRLAALLVGAGMLSGASSFLNQFQESEWDARMERTRERPIPSGKISELEALSSGTVLGMVGYLLVDQAVGTSAALVGLAVLLGYNFAYTPLKRVAWWNTLVGALVGALPVVMGQVAAAGSLGTPGALPFGLLFLWQLPHFFAIAWLYRVDYRAGGFAMLSRQDRTGRLSAGAALLGALAMVSLSLVPYVEGQGGWLAAAGVALLGIAMLAPCVRFLAEPTDHAAREVFRFSLVYLPTLFMLMLLDKAGS
jgi:protoheme IX farnesyltransferase